MYYLQTSIIAITVLVIYFGFKEHGVWQNQQFWEAAFYQDVQKDIKALYLPRVDTSPQSRLSCQTVLSPISPREVNNKFFYLKLFCGIAFNFFRVFARRKCFQGIKLEIILVSMLC